jgi:serine phosphatase RsbU (regulator of sigma subunit)
MKYMKVALLIFVTVLFIASCSNPQKERPEIVNGFLDLSSWNFQDNGTVNLNGQWEFYWGKLLESEDFKSNDSLQPEYISVPGGWATKESEGKSYPEFGCATYRLKIKIPDKNTDYNFIFHSIFTSARLLVNGSFCFENGKIATTRERSEPKITTNYYSPINYINHNDTLEIVIQVADFSYGGPAAGIRREITFGPDNQINTERIKSSSINSFLIGILLVMALYHLFLFVYRPKELSYLIFALLSMVVVTWTIYGSGMFIDYFSYEGYLMFGHLAPAVFPPLLVLFYYLIYKDEVHKIVVYVFSAIAIVFLVIILTSSATTISNIFRIFSLNMMVPLLYLLFYSLLRAIIKKRQGSILTYLSVLIMFGSVTHDALLSNSIILGFGNYISSYGFVALIVLQSLVLAQMFSLTFKKNINLNLNLEKIVKERTRIIDEQNRVLEMQNVDLLRQKEEIELQNEVLNLRNEEIETQRDFAHSQNEEITDSINYAKRIQAAMLPPKTYISELLNENFILYKPRDIVSGDFYWIKQVKQYVVLVAADCTGHGVPGAFMSILGINFLTEVVQRRQITQANQVLNELRKQIKFSLRQHGELYEAKDGINMALCVMDLKNNMMQYAGAYNPLYLIRGEGKEAKLIEYKADRMPIGYYQGKETPFTNHDIKLEQGDTFYLFSDGFVDQKGGKDEKRYMRREFRNRLLDIHDQPMLTQKDLLYQTLCEWMGSNPQTDDILVVGMRV